MIMVTNYLDVEVVVLGIMLMDLSLVMDTDSPLVHNDEILAWMDTKFVPFLVEYTLEVELARWLNDDSVEKSRDDIEVYA